MDYRMRCYVPISDCVRRIPGKNSPRPLLNGGRARFREASWSTAELSEGANHSAIVVIACSPLADPLFDMSDHLTNLRFECVLTCKPSSASYHSLAQAGTIQDASQSGCQLGGITRSA